MWPLSKLSDSVTLYCKFIRPSTLNIIINKNANKLNGHSVTLLVLFIAADEVLDEVERLSSLVDHQTDGVSQVARVSLLVPRLVDDLVVSFDL